MGQFPAILKQENHESPLHIGGILDFLSPLCKNFSEAEADILGRVSSRDWMPNEEFCPECVEFYKRGLAWKIPSERE